jgi:hypothetical protein
MKVFIEMEVRAQYQEMVITGIAGYQREENLSSKDLQGGIPRTPAAVLNRAEGQEGVKQ